MLAACENVLIESGFTIDDSEYNNKHEKPKNPDTLLKTMPFEQQRTKLKVCKRICCLIKSIDFVLRTNIHEFVEKQINRFEEDVHKHYKYIPSDDLLAGTDVEIVLEGDRSSDDPKVSNSRALISV